MNIIFFGQLGLPPLQLTPSSSRESRVEALARLAASDGHNVSVLGTSGYLSYGNYYGIELKHIPSLNPQKPGGWAYLLLGLAHLLWIQPDTIHVHDNRAALLLTLTRFLFHDTRIVWTIDAVPSKVSGFTRLVLSTITYNLSPHITTPSRTLQYHLLTEYDIKATYIPDGYEEPTVAPIALSHFGLRKGQYSVAIGGSDAALQRVKKAYKNAKTRKQLIIIKQKTPRAMRSLISGAAAVVIADESVSTTLLLEAMDASRAIIAPSLAAYQEILGTAGQYVAPRDIVGLTAALNKVVTSPSAQAQWGEKAHTRATHHFTWPRVMEDYHTLYIPHVRPVLLDSVQPRPLAQRAGLTQTAA